MPLSTEELGAGALDLLARTPLLDRGELGGIAGWSAGDTRRAVSFLLERESVDVVRHSTSLISSSERFHVNLSGVEALALNRGRSPEDVLGTYRVSHQWRDVLMGRLDGLAVVYRLIRGVAGIAGPVDVRLYRSHQLDATVTLPGGATIGVLRQGRTATRSSFARKLGRLFSGPLPGGLLVIASDPVRLRHLGSTGRLVSTSRPVHLILEEHAVAADRDSPTWWPNAYGTPVTLEAALSEPVRSLSGRGDEKPRRISSPEELPTVPLDSEFPVRRLPVELTPREKDILDTLADWTWLSLENLSAMLGVCPSRRLRGATRRLRALGLIHQVEEGRRELLFPSDRGMEPLAVRDRCSHRDLVKHWSVELKDPSDGLHRDNVSGGNSRQLLLHRRHTEAVQGFMASLACSARTWGLAVLRLDPPGHASRYFRDDRGYRSLRPDAFGMLGLGDQRCAFFLEYERRATYPSTMLEKLGPYIAYYSTDHPESDQEVVPRVLFVFERDDRAERFVDVARHEIRSAGVNLPLWVSSDEALSPGGPLQPVWRSPHSRELSSPMNDELSV